MRVLGISPSFPFVDETIFSELGISGSGHDSAAVLVCDGVVEAAIEQERLDRIKHSNKAPVEAIRFCLDKGNVTINEIDYIAISYREETLNEILKKKFLEKKQQKNFFDARYYIQRVIKEACGEFVEDRKIVFVSHNDSHAESAYAQSGFDDCLVLVTDGMGDESAGVIQSRKNGKTEILHTISVEDSLGLFYIHAIDYLGYRPNDEYKVMGLAPYGNPDEYKRIFKKIVKIMQEGRYSVENYYSLLFDIGVPRRKGEAFNQTHMDVAAAIQKTLEETFLHILKYYQAKTGHKKLCMAGGVAHNCSANGVILREEIFDDVFIQPASHDAGAVLGAALYVCSKYGEADYKKYPLKHVYWGSDIGTPEEIEGILRRYTDFIEYKKVDNVEKETAELLAAGKILGWVQGNSEFGPRALGNRSILADPRPEENKSIINQMVKKRESYRPFAPSVLEEKREKYFEFAKSKCVYDFMNTVVFVKKEMQQILGAITHVDGTARIQSVSKETNPKYWNLICEFEKLTGVPIVLNTSFNNNCEPIVDSVKDALVSYLTTNLHYLIVGDFIVSKKDSGRNAYLKIVVTVKPFVRMNEMSFVTKDNRLQTSYELIVNYDSTLVIKISKQCYDFLLKTDGVKSVSDIFEYDLSLEDKSTLIQELIDLWERRVIDIKPV